MGDLSERGAEEGELVAPCECGHDFTVHRLDGPYLRCVQGCDCAWFRTPTRSRVHANGLGRL